MTSRSFSSRKENTTCDVCGALFERTITTTSDGKEFGKTTTTCQKCKDKIRIEERLEELKKELPKAEELQRERWCEQYGVTGMFIEKDFDNFKKDLQQKAYEAVSNYKNNSLVLLSPNSYGVGKTHLVCALANRLAFKEESAYILTDVYNNVSIRKNPCPVHFNTESKLLARIRQSYNNKDNGGESEEDIYQELSKFNLLIIDDVGKVRPNNYSFLQGVYFRIIDDRYVNEQNIILTTNLDFKELEEHIGGACADRLREMCGKDGFIKMAGQSYRRKEAKQ